MAKNETQLEVRRLIAASRRAEEDLALADMLERQAKALRKSSPTKIDKAIGKAVSQLMTDTKAGMLTPRESLEAAIDITQFTPTHVSRDEPPHKQKSLDAFDRLSENQVPILIPGDFRRSTWGGVSTGGAPRIDISVPRGLGGLPDAHIVFDAKKLRIGRGESPPSFERRAKMKLSLLFDLDTTAIGAESINELVGSQTVWRERFGCGHDLRSNEGEIRDLTRHAQTLAETTGFELVLPSVRPQTRY